MGCCTTAVNAKKSKDQLEFKDTKTIEVDYNDAKKSKDHMKSNNAAAIEEAISHDDKNLIDATNIEATFFDG